MFITSVRLEESQDDSYVRHLPVVRHLVQLSSGLRLTSPVTIIVGDNGSGKSTLVESIAVAVGFDSSGGPLRHQLPAGAAPSHSELAQWLTLHGKEIPLHGYFLRAETHYDAVGALETEAPDAGESLKHMSHGESVMSLLDEQISEKAGLYLFDEPESGLSIVRQMALVAEIHQAVRQGSQFIIATHSPIILAVPGATIIEISEEGMAETVYDEAEAVVATREFLEDPAGTLRYLME